MQWLISVVLFVMGAALFVAPHHLADEANTRSKTMAAILAEMTRVDGIAKSPGSLMLFLGVVTSTLVVFFPGVVTTLNILISTDWRRTVLAIGGIVCILFAIAAFIIILFSHVSFSWGGSSKPTSPETPFTYIIPIFPALCGLWFIAAAIFPNLARATRLLPD